MNEKYDWGFGLSWLVACAIGTALGGTVAFFTMWTAGEAAAEALGDVAGGFVAGALFGGLFALGANVGPGILLQRRGINGVRWIVYSVLAGALGAGIGLSIAFGLLEELGDGASAVVIGLILGLPIGLAQWLVLRQHGMLAFEWPLISLVAYLLAAVLITSGNDETVFALIVAGTGLLVGTVTGLGMVWLQRRQRAAAV